MTKDHLISIVIALAALIPFGLFWIFKKCFSLIFSLIWITMMGILKNAHSKLVQLGGSVVFLGFVAYICNLFYTSN